MYASNQGISRKIKKESIGDPNNNTFNKNNFSVVNINIELRILLVFFAVIYATAAVKNELTIRTVLIDPALGAVMLVIF